MWSILQVYLSDDVAPCRPDVECRGRRGGKGVEKCQKVDEIMMSTKHIILYTKDTNEHDKTNDFL